MENSDTLKTLDSFHRVWPKLADGAVSTAEDNLPVTDTIYGPGGFRKELNGQTSFFRHAEAIVPLLESFARAGKPDLRVLAAPSSIGCEAYTLSALAHHHQRPVQIDAFDLSDVFTGIARRGLYPWGSLWDRDDAHCGALTHDARSSNPQDLFSIRPDVAAQVNFLEPTPFEKFLPQGRYDAVMVNNLFMYMNDDQIKASMRIVDQTDCDIFIFLHGENGRDDAMNHFRPKSFVSVYRNPDWQLSPLADRRGAISEYNVWARLRP